MTEQEWLVSSNPYQMLCAIRDTLTSPGDTRLLHRKLRLFVVASVRQSLDLLSDPFLDAVAVGERYADNLADGFQRDSAVKCASMALDTNLLHIDHLRYFASCEAMRCCVSDGQIAIEARYVASPTDVIPPEQKASLLRCIFGNPFYQVRAGYWQIVSNNPPGQIYYFQPAWIRGPNVQALAQLIYDEHDWELMPVLADALVDAGCHDTVMLDHLRQDRLHGRGCWVLDCILSRT